ncbi:MAG TPA: amino acid permease [Rhodothermales bacterium]
MRQIFRRKPHHAALIEHVDPQVEVEPQLRRSLSVWQLGALGVGAIVGAGIFSGAGTAIAGGPGHLGAGPALIVSYILVAIACGFAALCYAEFAAMIPQAGSAYTYAYATFGELVAWIIGWDLIIEYAVGNVALAVSWSGYFQELLRGVGMPLPEWLATDYVTAFRGADAVAAAVDPSTLAPHVLEAAEAVNTAPNLLGVPFIFNLPAVLIVAFITWILVLGIRESARFNTAMVVVKLGILFVFVVVGAFFVRPENWTPFAPNGFPGIWMGASLIFFAYIGFDAISTAAEEAKNPQRDMPRAMIGSLVITSLLYILVTVVLTGLVPWQQLGTAEPLATAFAERGLDVMAGVISVAALFATASVLLVFQLGQPRIFFSMARDGLLPSWAARVHPKHRTPHVSTIVTGILVGVFAAFAPIDAVIELTNIGTLFAFVLVSGGVWLLRHLEPDRPRPFRTPWVPFVPIAAIVSCGWLMVGLPGRTWLRFALWLLAGLVIYALYGYRRSRLHDGGNGS